MMEECVSIVDRYFVIGDWYDNDDYRFRGRGCYGR